MATKKAKPKGKEARDDDEDRRGGALSERERRFVVAFTGVAAGNATHAAKLAGYSDTSSASLASMGSRLLTRERVLDAIRDITEGDPLIARGAELQRFWSKVMRGDALPHITSEGAQVEVPASVKDRLKAAELLGKAQGLFVERLEVHNVDLSRATDEQLARIAAGEDPVKVLGGKQ
jgi:phage terminase small subunit